MPLYILTSKPNFILTEPDASILGFLSTSIICRLLRIKVILDIRSVPVETFGFEGFMINLWFNFSVLFAKRLFDGMTTITSLMKEELCHKFQLSKKQIGVWTSGVSTKLFAPMKYTSASTIFKESLGLSSKFVVFYHGKFSPTRGLKQSIEAIKKVRYTHPQIVLLLLGTGPIASELKRKVREEDLKDNVFIHDPVDHNKIPLFISMCNVGIVPLPNNQFWRSQSPLKLLEYLAMEKVAIVSDIPAHRSVLGNSECCLYLPSINPSDIAQVIKYAYINKKNLEKVGKNGRRSKTFRDRTRLHF
jgi:glycosyltransferase involved in cell wall biosynthesis